MEARKQPGCRTLIDEIYGIGELTSVTILAELGDARRFQNSRDAVRYSGLDITVHQSDARRSPGHLSRQGPSTLRWALYEAAQAARRPSSPDRQYYLTTAERIGGNRACIAIARNLLKRSYQCVTNAEGGVGVGDTVHRRCCARDGGLLALRRRPCGGRRQTALELR
jgi:transposase